MSVSNSFYAVSIKVSINNLAKLTVCPSFDAFKLVIKLGKHLHASFLIS